MQRLHLFLSAAAISLLVATASAKAGSAVQKWLGQTVYIPIYSHIYGEERFRDKPLNLTATLSIRNTDPVSSVTLQSVDYYDSAGNKLRSYIPAPQTIPPLGAARYIVQENDTSGGFSAKFLVTWSAAQGTTEPIIESIMIGTKLQQGISFVSRGMVIDGVTTE